MCALTHKFLINLIVFFLWIASLSSLFAQDNFNFSSVSIEKSENVEDRIFDEWVVDDIISLGENFLGKPYRYKGPKNQIFDCSGYLGFIFEENGFKLPRTSSAIAQSAEIIDLSNVRKGDFLFFKGRNINSNSVGHISIITRVEGDQIEMMHSCSRGIIKEIYNNSQYYNQRLLFAGRHPEMAKNYFEKIKAPISQDSILNQLDSITQEAKEPKDTIRIMGVGDIMLGTNFPNTSYLPPNDGNDLLLHIKPIIQQADIAFGNLEGVFLTGNGPVKQCSNPAVCYAFKSPDHYVNHISDAGFNLLSVANNHVRDFGDKGILNTIKVLNEAGIPHAGLLQCPYTIFKIDSLTIGFAAFAPNSGTVSINDNANAKKIVSHLDSVCDMVIVSFHGGAEGATKNHITRQNEIFLGENRGNPYQFARVVIDAGADIVFGHGPHVVRAIDLYKGRFIAYSMGNFATYGRFNLSGLNGLAPIIDILVDKNGEFISGQIHSFKQVGEGGPIPDENLKALKEIAKLTLSDIPEAPIEISDSGVITIK